jgi:hypothetical protein
VLCFEAFAFFRSKPSPEIESAPEANAYDSVGNGAVMQTEEPRRRFQPIHPPPDALAGGGLRGGNDIPGDIVQHNPLEHNRQDGDNDHVLRAHDKGAPADVAEEDGMPERVAHAAVDDLPEPDLDGLMKRVGDALGRYQRPYLDELSRKSGKEIRTSTS